ncbi:unnamed protein product [Rotaria sp. Silwood1]|nr:unnamed protein product [Rotaria sp. Silwood1]
MSTIEINAPATRVPLRASSTDIHPNAKWSQNGITVAGGNGWGSQTNQLYYPLGLYVDDDRTIYVADHLNHRIVKWKSGATNGKVVAGGNEYGNGAHQLNRPVDVIIGKESDSLVISDRDNKRVVRWPRLNGTSGETIISNIACVGLTMDDNGSLYVVDDEKHEVRRYQIGDTKGTVVAGGNGEGNRSDQLSEPRYVFVDRDHSVYVSDGVNHRVMKWEEGAKQGIVVAGGQGQGNSLAQLNNPQGVVVDQLGTVYVTDDGNHRIMRWPNGATQGSVIVDGNGKGAQSNQLNYPIGLSFDRHSNLYVVDWGNHRVQKFNIEHLVNHDTLEQYNKQLQDKTTNTGEKRAPPSDDDDTNVMNMDKRTIYDNNNQQQGQFNISDQALTYAVENNLPSIKIECSPRLEDREQAKKFVINFFKCIADIFRKKYPGNLQPLGFHHWWINTTGNILYGVVNDIDLCIYLCDIKHYPTKIDNVTIRPDPPKRLPPQNNIVIKFIPNELCKDDIKEEIKNLYPSIYTIDNMMGTMGSNSRHIRVEFWQKDDYFKIINDGKIGLQGQVFEVEEYLPPPKILICSKCNTPDHAEKVCLALNDICRRCGQNRNNGDKHNECSVLCHHCGGNHMVTDYKCPIIVKFRQQFLIRLKHDQSKLPPNIKIFIPVDCRVNGDRNRILTTQNSTESRHSIPSRPPAINPWTTNQNMYKETPYNNQIDQTIKTLVNELAETKKNFETEREKIKNCYEKQIQCIQQGWVMLQQQVQTQNQCITLMSAMIKDNISTMNQLFSTITTINETMKSKCSDELDRNKIEMSQMIINSILNHFKNLNDSYTKQEYNLTLIMNKQSTIFETALNSILSSIHE